MAVTRSGLATDDSTEAQNFLTEATRPVMSNPSSSSYKDESRNPYHLGHGDHPSVNLVPKILTGGENYSSWRRSMMVALLARNKVQFVNGKLHQPDPSHDDYDSWCRCNNTVISWILHVVSTEIVDSIMYLDDASMIWSDLYERFHQNNGPRVFEVKRTMQALTQGSTTIQTYFTRLKILWDSVREYRPQLVCHCGAMKTILEYQEQDRVLEFLVGLNDSYSVAQSQILMQDPLPTINKVYSTLIQEERQRGLHYAPPEPHAPVSITPHHFASNAQFNWSKVTCTHCGLSGHTIAKCYKLHGYPLVTNSMEKGVLRAHPNQLLI
ncbi:uncharacterized protein LOC133805634 [Humulus lupulus]|uniref:uncharacterized protein LOC133805634 n=1 Tax=Humulus lupulus TaxID=3486 RepID=UPI002B414956|nr:uncharacterized protein LOC133805634 [Humulus lupulus]